MSEQRQNVVDPSSELDERDDAVISQALWWSLGGVLCVAVSIGGFLFFTQPADEPSAPDAAPPAKAKKRILPPVTLPRLKFTDITQSAGITYVHESGASEQKLFPETMGGGVAFFDYDNDGDPDLLFVNSKRWDGSMGKSRQRSTVALYANDGKGNFTDVSNGSELDVSMFGMGVAVGDIDNDGLPDVYITGLNENRLFRNLGDGTFRDVTSKAGVAGDKNGWSTSAGFLDYDNDGDLDLFVCNYVNWSREFDSGQSFTLDGKQRAYGLPQRFPGSFCYLFRNEGNGTFADVSKSAGIQVVSEKKGTPTGKSLGVCFADMDGDGYLDIAVANDTVRNFLFRNRGNGTFQERGVASNMAFDTSGNARGAMGIDVARFRNSDEMGVAIGNFSNEMTALYVSEKQEWQFRDLAIINGIGPVTRNELTFGLFFFDADLDGRLDLFASNGHLERDIAKVQARQSYQQPPQLLWNCGPGFATEFLPIVAPRKPVRKEGETEEAFRKRVEQHPPKLKDFEKRMADFVRPLVGRGAAYADIDGDGDLDVVIVANGQPARLLRNDQQLGHHWLQVKLTGRRSNRSAIGAWVELHLPGGTILRQQVMPTRSYQSQVESVVTFGLGKIDRIEKLRIRWPGGETMELNEPIRIDSRVNLIQPE